MIGRLCSFSTWFLRFCIYKLIFIDSKHETCNKILDLEQVSVSAYMYFQLIYVLFSLYLEFSLFSPFLPHLLFLSVSQLYQSTLFNSKVFYQLHVLLHMFFSLSLLRLPLLICFISVNLLEFFCMWFFCHHFVSLQGRYLSCKNIGGCLFLLVLRQYCHTWEILHQ